MKKLPLDVIYRLYKAADGDIIDNTYVRLNGGYRVSPSKANERGYMSVTPIYELWFKDLSDGEYYWASNGISIATIPKHLADDECFHEPFKIPYTIDPFPVYKFGYDKQTVSVMTWSETPAA